MPERTPGYKRDLIHYISGRRVDFISGREWSWGVEISLPFRPIEKRYLYERYAFKIPENLKTLKFLDLSPQESLPKDLRTIKSIFNNNRGSILDTLVKEPYYRLGEIDDFFWSVFGRHKKQIRVFNSILSESTGTELLFVSGHSLDDPWVIGEETEVINGKLSSGKWGGLRQHGGNKVPVRKILQRYNDPSTYAAILFLCCYTGTKGPKVLDVPVVYPEGEVYGPLSSRGLLPVRIVVPN